MTKTNASSTSGAKRTRSTKAAPAELIFNHTETIDAGDLALAALIDSLGGSDEIVETVPEKIAFYAVDESALDAAVSGAEASEAMIAAATPDGIEGSEAPTGTVSDVPSAPVPGADDAPDASAVAKVKKVAIPRKHYTDKTERLKDKLGAGLAEYSVLTMADALVTDEDLAKVMEATMQIIRDMNKKEQNWAVKFVEFLAGKKSSLSEVTLRALTVLNKDGHITTGNEGNLFKDLLAKPYSPGAARAMGGNNIGMLKDLKVIIPEEGAKGKFVANPDSLLLAKAKSMIFAAPAVSVA